MNIFFPISINITNKQILIIGGGSVAFNKAVTLSYFTNRISVIATNFCPKFKFLTTIELKKKMYDSDDLKGVFMVYICTCDKMLNLTIKTECNNRNILVNICDSPKSCNFISPAVYKDNNITIAVSSNAQNVKKSIDIRNQIKKLVERNQLIIK
ncbi:MAG: bifunctional precorrin-2 dehydrogenase/sirohydrochlorin ferrochelatase [Bacteroidales bacterium OttesenSCG-928-I14]|jgi:siroheme synthase-like protein|nr:bifunctional precorrin-2 dehydrogenase/sirohydrochlorin ferrochelatase [Bacteroidales bacterium OttesenSCG-928-I14]